MTQSGRALLFLVLVLWLTGCTTFESGYSDAEREQLMTAIVGEPDVPDANLLALAPEITSQLDQRIRRHWPDSTKIARLREYLYGADHRNIRYSPTHTLSASETFYQRAGNCLALTSLYIAAARHVGVDAHYETLEIRPTWDSDGATMVRYEHIIAAGDYMGGEYIMDFLPDFSADEIESQRISDERAEALFYSNRGAEALLAGEVDAAIEYLRYALVLWPEFADGWNNMGAAQRRLGNADFAEFSYRHALALDANHFSALSNLAQFYLSSGREEEASEFLGQVARYRRRNPYFHFYLAQMFYREGRMPEAEALLLQAIRLKKDDLDFYQALAETYRHLGEADKQQKMLARAERYARPTLAAPGRELNSVFRVID